MTAISCARASRSRWLGAAVLLATTALVAAPGDALAGPSVTGTLLWTAPASNAPTNTSEIVTYEESTGRVYVAGGDGVDVFNAADGSLITSLPIAGGAFGGVTSVAVRNGVLAAAVPNSTITNDGFVFFYDTANLAAAPTQVGVGALPDMVAFSPDGSKVLVANEGEAAGGVNPVGSISVVDVASKAVQTAGFGAFDAQKAALVTAGVRIYGNAAGEAATVSVSQDLEPEYIAFSPDGSKAFVTLQEANAFAVVDLSAAPTVSQIIPLGYKDHGLAGNGIDASDTDAGVNINTFQNVFGMYEPDSIATFTFNGQTYYGTANEGDTRGFEEVRVNNGAVVLEPAFPVADAKNNAVLGRLTITNTMGDTDGDGDYDELYVPGARSFSFWDENGALVFDSGDMIEQILKAGFPELIENGRADNKGPEPESIAFGEMGGILYAFVGLERSGAVMVFAITDLNAPSFAGVLSIGAHDEFLQAPEGLYFIGAGASPDGRPWLLVTDEDSHATYAFALQAVPEPGIGAVLAGVALAGLAVRRRRTLR